MTINSKRKILKKYTGRGGTGSGAVSAFNRSGDTTRQTINKLNFGPTSGIKDSINGVSSGIKGGSKGSGNSLTAEAFKQTFFHPAALPLGNKRAPQNLPKPTDSNFLKRLIPKK